MKLFVTVILLLVTLTIDTQAELLLKDYEEVKEQQEFKTYIYGVGVGFEWANTILEGRKQAPLYCPPDKLALTEENFLGILDGTINEKGTILGPDAPVESILVVGLAETFPCKQ